MESPAPWFQRFCDPAADRLTVLVRTLHDRGLRPEILETGRFRHLQLRGSRPARPAAGEKVLFAHYDRVPGSPGANDNGSSVAALVDYLVERGDGALRVVFTDGEELGPGGRARDQGSYALALHWDKPHLFPVVFDMTGIGDTVVLGHLGEELLRKVRPEDPLAHDVYSRTRLAARRWLATCGPGVTEVNTPFSDDLGLFLAGLPAAQVSLLPRKQALTYKKDGTFPPAWAPMHTENDTPATLWPESRRLVVSLIRRLETFPVG